MKKIIHIVTVCLICSVAWGCIKDDNYPGPNAAVNGSIIDSVSGQPLQSGPNDERMYALQTSYTAGTPIPLYWDIQSSGLYNNSEVFSGTYKMYPTDGAFVPLVYTSGGAIIDHGSKIVNVPAKANVTTNWTVTPFLEVSWVGDPVLNADGTVSVSCKFVRGTTNPLWIFNVTDVFFFISNTSFVSSGSYDNTLSYDQNYTAAPYNSNSVPVNGKIYNSNGNPDLGTTVTLKSIKPLGLHQGYYLRVGARTADNVNKRYNYTAVKIINVP